MLLTTLIDGLTLISELEVQYALEFNETPEVFEPFSIVPEHDAINIYLADTIEVPESMIKTLNSWGFWYDEDEHKFYCFT